ncbi:MAG: Ku protein [Proteiniphilum sp.]|jgi:DNA end-binding protein Ku|nr:Ku protein [Proteiniphilum sp.]NCB24734.1 Ku protein [Bacteroidia bacterium]MDD2939039.1 Ku protein [Proteiniphilum sp.]MDD3076226.1 Ku protein [Proteiniphilum sp.]MDD3954899.1 Ku protein [Proteiniphilum sp.]
MKSIWNGAIAFGLVNIPVKLYAATESSSLDLDMLDKRDLSNIRFKRVNDKTGKEVGWDDIVKGYKLEDRYIVLSDEDFEAASPEKSKIFSIQQFVQEEEIESIYFETPYFLEPQKHGENAYALLREALNKTNKVGVGTFVLRNKENLGIVKPYRDLLIINKIRFPEELREYDELKVPSIKIKPGELKLAISLIEQTSEPFDSEKFTDTYTADLLKIIEQKAKGKKLKVTMPQEATEKTFDLMEKLKASLAKNRKNVS